MLYWYTVTRMNAVVGVSSDNIDQKYEQEKKE